MLVNIEHEDTELGRIEASRSPPRSSSSGRSPRQIVPDQPGAEAGTLSET